MASNPTGIFINFNNETRKRTYYRPVRLLNGWQVEWSVRDPHDSTKVAERGITEQKFGKRSDALAWIRTKGRTSQLDAGYLATFNPFPLATGVAEHVVEKVVEKVVEVPGAQLDPEQVRTMVEELVVKHMARQAPAVLKIELPEGVRTKVEGGHYLLPRLIKLLAAGFNVFLWGPAGTGKTTAGQMAAEALKVDSEIDTLDPSTFRSMVQGYMTPDGKPVHTTFTRCWTKGLTYIADEVDNAPGHVQTLFNSALANGHAPLAWGNVERSKKFGFVATGNTPGRPTSQFPDRRPMSAAFADRLYFMYWPLDPAIECRSVGLPVPPAPERKQEACTPQAWVVFVQRLREWAAVNMPTLMVTPRASLAGVKALALGETPEEVADALIFRGCDAEMKRKALNAVKWEVK